MIMIVGFVDSSIIKFGINLNADSSTEKLKSNELTNENSQCHEPNETYNLLDRIQKFIHEFFENHSEAYRFLVNQRVEILNNRKDSASTTLIKLFEEPVLQRLKDSLSSTKVLSDRQIEIICQLECLIEANKYLGEIVRREFANIQAYPSANDVNNRIVSVYKLLHLQLNDISRTKTRYNNELTDVEKEQLSIQKFEDLFISCEQLKKQIMAYTAGIIHASSKWREGEKIDLDQVEKQYLNGRSGSNNQAGSTGAIVKLTDANGRPFILKHLWPMQFEVDEPIIYPGDLGFIRESSLLSALNHPNVVKYCDGGYTNLSFEKDSHLPAGPYMILEYADGGDLSKSFKEESQTDLHTKLGCLLQVGRGLTYLHSKGIVHRDLKPANILLFKREFKEPIAKLADLDCACYLDDRKTRKQISGTAERMAPQFFGWSKHRGEVDLIAAEVLSFGLLIAEGLNPTAAADFFESYTQSVKSKEAYTNAVQLLITNLKASNPEAEQLVGTLTRALSFDQRERPKLDELLTSLDTLYRRVE